MQIKALAYVGAFSVFGTQCQKLPEAKARPHKLYGAEAKRDIMLTKESGFISGRSSTQSVKRGETSC